jgi:hypothetical protein
MDTTFKKKATILLIKRHLTIWNKRKTMIISQNSIPAEEPITQLTEINSNSPINQVMQHLKHQIQVQYPIMGKAQPLTKLDYPTTIHKKIQQRKYKAFLWF